MYAEMWRRLPGPTPLRAVVALVLIFVAVAVLFLWVFPWAEQHLPFLEVTVDQGTSTG
jgi:hypothetical protein